MQDTIDSSKSIYDRLGGEAAMDSFTMAFYANVCADDRVSHYFVHVDLMKQIQHQKKLLTFALGGPFSYKGRSLKEAHKNLNISKEDFAAIAEILSTSLVDLNVDQALIDEILVIVASTKDDIIS